MSVRRPAQTLSKTSGADDGDPDQTDRTALLADAEWLEDFHHAGDSAFPTTSITSNIGKGEQFQPAFLKIAPNNRMPAIVDPEGPGGEPISIFESGAILQYLGRKFDQFYPSDERAKVAVDEWLFWQIGGLGPMAGQTHHFRNYAPEKIEYGIKRYTDETHRLYGVMNKRLADNEYLGGADYSIADMASIGWVVPYKNQGQDIEDSRTSNAGSTSCTPARPSKRAWRSVPSIARTWPTTKRPRRCCSASAPAEGPLNRSGGPAIWT